MKRFLFIALLLLAGCGALYVLGIGPFDQGTAKEQQTRRRNRSVSVRVGEVKLGTVEHRLSYVGSLTANALVTVAPKTAGRVEELLVSVGDFVREGQILARLEKDELIEQLREAQASLEVTEATLKGRMAELKNLRRRWDNAKTLIKKDLVARDEVNTLETQVLSAESQVELTKAQRIQMEARRDNARIRLAHSDVRSPFEGYVSKRFVDRGALVDSNTPLVEIVDINVVKVMVAVVESDYRKISPGQPATVMVDAYPGRRFEGKITRLSPVLDQETRTGEVEIELSNEHRALNPGMFARVEVLVDRRENVLLVPVAAQVRTEQGQGVFRVGEDDKADFVPAKNGLSQDGWVEVSGALKPGDRVVTLGSSLLRNGQRLTIIGEGGGSEQAKKAERRRRGGKDGSGRGGRKGGRRSRQRASNGTKGG